jgi:hypothetical protein
MDEANGVMGADALQNHRAAAASSRAEEMWLKQPWGWEISPNSLFVFYIVIF